MATDSEEQVSPGEKQMEGSIFYFFLPKHSPILFITRQPETLKTPVSLLAFDIFRGIAFCV